MLSVPALALAASSLFFAPQEQAKVVFLRDARVVVKPGTILERASIVLKDGKVAEIGENLQAPSGAEVVDCAGLTAYPGFVHPFMRVSVEGLSPAQTQGGGGPGGGGGGGQGRQSQTAAQQAEAMARRDKDPFGVENSVFAKHKTGTLKQKDVSAFASLAKSGYGLANVSASGGLIGPTSAVFSLKGKDLDPSVMKKESPMIPVSLTSRGFGSYPGSTMGVIASIRQAFIDASPKTTWKPEPSAPGAASLPNLKAAAYEGGRIVFDDLTEVSFFQAQKVAKEFGLSPVFGFRQDAGAVKDLLDDSKTTVMLKGAVPSRPTISDNLASVGINSVRTYFNEMQVGAEMEKAGLDFVYAPTSSTEPLEGIRKYVRGGLSRDAALAAMTTRPAELLGMSESAGTLEAGKAANVLLTQGDVFDDSSQVMAVYVEGQKVDFPMPAHKKAEELVPSPAAKLIGVNYDVFPVAAESVPAHRLYKNATVWTQGPQGILRNADVLIEGGKIRAVGRGLKAPAGCQVIDATGKHISPGIWDCHSHTGISGGVNEGSNMVTIECRIADVTNHRAPNIYNQLSGGTVGANQLHGSANVIGGQNNVVKWRWGLRPSEYRVAGAPEGVKFALGQNPIREDASGGGAQQQPVGTTLMTWRPRTRMGNEESIRRALQLGKEYNQAWEDFRSGKSKTEPRRDLQLEAIGEILLGKRVIHSHGYRSDEMLALMRIVQEYGGKIATLQHVLEGYKIADEMALQGVGGSTFSDWWGYKLEAYDAIPYNAALMASRGVTVSVNSDSDNHARRLNQEAAKSMRYGGVSAEEALSYVTIQPAKQLGIADTTGSLEVGKDADMVLWSAEPTSILAVCLETYVDGIKRFDRANDAKQRETRDAELRAAKEVLEAGKSANSSPFTTEATNANVTASIDGANIGRSSATFGIGPIKGEPGTMRYARRSVLISGATVHPMDGKPFVGDVLLGSDGRIQQVSTRLNANGAETINGRGKHLYPGLIDPVTSIGLNEIGQVPASDDSSERGNFHPDYRVERVINPEWETMAVARQQGVLTVLVKPSGSGVAGQAALINTEGYTWEDLTVQGGVAMACASTGANFDFGDETFNLMALMTGVSEDHEEACDDGHLMAGLQQRQPQGGDAPLAGLTRQLVQAREYLANVRSATPEKPVARDQRQEAMALVANGEMPVMLSVSTATDIKNAVAWAEKERVRIVLYGCRGAGEIADWLAAKQVPICLNAVYQMPTGDQPVDNYYSLPAKLTKAGVKFCLTTENDRDVRQIRDQAGWAAAYGVDREEAARLITLRAAEVLGIQERLGAIKPGLDGTVILTDGEIIETKTRVLRAWIQSREVPLDNKQTRLYDKYRTRPKAKK